VNKYPQEELLQLQLIVSLFPPHVAGDKAEAEIDRLLGEAYPIRHTVGRIDVDGERPSRRAKLKHAKSNPKPLPSRETYVKAMCAKRRDRDRKQERKNKERMFAQAANFFHNLGVYEGLSPMDTAGYRHNLLDGIKYE
jgi:hypothetical protein